MSVIAKRARRRKSVNFLTKRLSTSFKHTVKDTGQRWMAVPYVSQGAAKQLQHRQGDVLITRFDDRTIKSGQTDPREILGYLRRGIEAHHCSSSGTR